MINLGSVPFIEDEGIRGLVALEMERNDNYVAPTLNGEPYFKKPPLWNWILLTSFHLFGYPSEFAARFPAVLCLFGFCLSIFFWVRQHRPESEAVLAALIWLTCGRVLFWDSLLALIDIAFAWMIFIMLVSLFEYHRKQQYLLMYVVSYAFCAVAFMLKALPAVVFLGLSMLALLLYHRQWHKLFTWQHLLGALTFVSLLGIYLFVYTRFQPLSELMTVFLDESTQRTFIEHGLWETLLQLAIFPLEMVYHFLPWSVLIILLFQRNIIPILTQDRFIRYSVLIFVVNIWIYWISPAIYPRYLFPLAPFYFVVSVYLYQQSQLRPIKKWLDYTLFGIVLSVTLGSLVIFSNPVTSNLPNIFWRWVFPVVPMILAIIAMSRYAGFRLHFLCIFLLAARLGFDLIVLPARATDSAGVPTRADALRVSSMIGDQDLSIYRSDTMRYEMSFYLTRDRESIIPVVSEVPSDGYLLVNPANYPNLAATYPVVDSIKVRRVQPYIYVLDVRPTK